MLIIRPLKPFYKNTEEKIIRMGNFKDTGKEINYEDDSLIKLFEIIRKPTSREKIVEVLQENDKLSLEEINEALDYLIKEKFLIINIKLFPLYVVLIMVFYLMTFI